jgi:hypothetical protein
VAKILLLLFLKAKLLKFWEKFSDRDINRGSSVEDQDLGFRVQGLRFGVQGSRDLTWSDKTLMNLSAVSRRNFICR